MVPDKTQPHVDRLIGSRVQDLEVLERLAEGRFSTLYRARRASAAPVVLEVLRTGLTSADEEVRAVDAVKCSSVVPTVSFGTLPDGRRTRVLEPLEGESLEQRLGRGRLAPAAAIEVLTKLAQILLVTHAWALVHGNLVASCVWVGADGAVRLLDFGLQRASASRAADLKGLGLLGFAMLTGDTTLELAPTTSGAPAQLELLLRDLVTERLDDLGAVVKTLETLQEPVAPPAPVQRRRRPLVPLVLGVTALALSALAWVIRAEAPQPTTDEDTALLEAAGESPQPDVVPSQRLEESDTEPAPKPSVRRSAPVVPSAQQLQDVMVRFERQLRSQRRSADELDQALSVLNKQRLRLVGAPSAIDRQEVARQLSGWRRSYLRK